MEFCFHLSPILRLLPSNINTVKKVKTFQKRWRPIQCQLRQRINIVQNLTIRNVTNSNSFRNPGKVKVLRYVQCAERFQYCTWRKK